VGGNKPNLIERYRQWWNTQSSGANTKGLSVGPSVGVAESLIAEIPTNPANTASAPEPVTVTALDTSNDLYTAPLLQRLLVPARLELSTVTLVT
jgi:hypothetical protein